MMYHSKESSKMDAMDNVAQKISVCNLCSLAESCTNKVIGAGSLDCDLVLIGEAPGKKEDETGFPFVGAAGMLLDKILDQADLKRENIFITNILKCRPTDNRRPRKREVEKCESHLNAQLMIIKPKVIAPMGNVATNYFFARYGIEKTSIGDAHGRMRPIKTKWCEVKLVPLYHPAAAIYNQGLKTELVKDMKRVSRLI